jgi:hypothetical protein
MPEALSNPLPIVLHSWDSIRALNPRFISKIPYDSFPTASEFDFFRVEESGQKTIRRRFMIGLEGFQYTFVWFWSDVVLADREHLMRESRLSANAASACRLVPEVRSDAHG